MIDFCLEGGFSLFLESRPLILFLIAVSYKIIILLCFPVFTCSCSGDNGLDDVLPSQRTVFVYMAADNNLYKNAKADMEEMLLSEIPANNHLLVYLDAPEWSENACPQLFEVQQGKMIPVKQYELQNSASGEVLYSVISDAITLFPAEAYGLILWSHGTGWLPEGVFDALKQSAAPRSFGKDGNSEMSIIELAESLPVKFEYIIFDACLMGGIEVFYQLRDKTDVIIASPTETLVAGLSYDRVIPFLFAATPNYAEIAQSYMSYYKNQTGNIQSATIAVIDTKHLKPFADIIRKAIEDSIAIIPPNRESVQKYTTQGQVVFYDLQDYLEQAIQSDDYIVALKQQIARVVMYHDFTPYFLSHLAIEKSCGLSVYVSPADDNLDNRYKLFDWYIDSNLLCSW